MRRREFIKLLSGAATTWPVTAPAQLADRVRRIGVLMAFDGTDARARNWLSLFDSELAKLGWTGGRKPHIQSHDHTEIPSSRIYRTRILYVQ
jgi:hypothetical protein